MGQNFKCISRLGDSLKIHSKTPQLWLENFPSAWIQFFNMPWWICCRNTTWHHAWHIALKLNSSCFIIDCCFELTWAHQKKQNEFSLKPAQCTRWVGYFLFDICLLIKVGRSQGVLLLLLIFKNQNKSGNNPSGTGPSWIQLATSSWFVSFSSLKSSNLLVESLHGCLLVVSSKSC